MPGNLISGISRPSKMRPNVALNYYLYQHEQNTYNIRTLSKNITFICTCFRNMFKSLASFSSLFRSECILILYLTTMYVYCVNPAKSERLKQTDKLSETRVVLIVFLWCHLGNCKDTIQRPLHRQHVDT